MPKKKLAKKDQKRLRKKITIGHEADGKPVYKWASGYSKPELDANADQIKKAYLTGARDVERDAVFRVYAQRYYDAYRKDRISQAQQTNLGVAMNNYILPYIGDKQMLAISAMDLQMLMNRTSGKSKTLIRDIYSILRQTFAHAYANGVIERNPAVGIVMPEAKKTEERRALTNAEARVVLQLGREHPYGLLLLILYYLGLRRGEALGGRWEDVDFRNAQYHVLRDIDFFEKGEGSLKTESSRRILPIPQELLNALQATRGLPGAYILQSPTGGHWSRGMYCKRWDALRKEMLNIDPTIESTEIGSYTRQRRETEIRRAKREGRIPHEIIPVYGSVLTAHYLRHNYASILYDAGVDVLTAQKLMGHSDPATTLRIYTHLKESRERIRGDVVQAAFDRDSTLIRL